MNEKRKQALVMYLAALFGVAFLIVCVSLGIQVKKNTVNATSAEKVIALQSELQVMRTEKLRLEQEVQEQEDSLSEYLESVEFLEGIAHEATAKIQEQELRLQASDAVIHLLQAQQSGEAEALAQALAEAEPLKEFMNETALECYDSILATMETTDTDE